MSGTNAANVTNTAALMPSGKPPVESIEDAIDSYVASEEETLDAATPKVKAAVEVAEEETEEKVEDKEEEKVDDKEDEAKPKAEDAALERIANREEALRKAEADFDKKVEAAVKAKTPDFSTKTHKEILSHFGHDEELVFKELLLERLSKDNPKRAELEKEVATYKREAARDLTVKQLEAKLAAKEKQEADTVAQKKAMDEIVSGAREYVGKIKPDSKDTPLLAKAVEAKKNDKVFDLVMEEIAIDSYRSLARGEQRDIISFGEAAKLVEGRLSKMAELLQDKQDAKKANISSPKPNKPNKVSGAPVQSWDNLLDEATSAGMQEYARAKQKK